MKNRIKIAAVGIAAAVMLAGCGQVPQGAATEPGIPVETAAVETTAPAETRYQFGDIVWQVCTCAAEEVDHLTRYAVVAHEGDTLMVTHAISDSPEALRECLPEYISSGHGEVWSIDAAECFPSKEDALAEIARLTADAFEAYRGCE